MALKRQRSTSNLLHVQWNLTAVTRRIHPPCERYASYISSNTKPLSCYEQCMAPLHYHRPYNRSWDINRLHCTMQWQQGALPTSLTPAGALEWLDDSNCHTHYVTWCNFRCGHAIDHVMDTCDACAVHLLHCMHSVTCNKRTLQRHSHHQFPNLFP